MAPNVPLRSDKCRNYSSDKKRTLHRQPERLRALGLSPAQARSTALFRLATDLPAAVLARMLGIHISVAAVWQRASAGDWTSYAADISRRVIGR